MAPAGASYDRETVGSWGIPWNDPTADPEASVVNIGWQVGEAYHGRTLPLFSTSLFVCAASLPVFSDESETKPVTPYRAGVIVAHEIRHLWHVARGWSDTRGMKLRAMSAACVAFGPPWMILSFALEPYFT